MRHMTIGEAFVDSLRKHMSDKKPSLAGMALKME